MGCRAKGSKSTLLRVVAAEGSYTGHPSDGDTVVLVPDPAGRLPGRGAHVHLDLRCVDLAEKRRAFPRALRLGGPLDVAPVRQHVQQAAPPAGSTTRTAQPVRGEQVDPPMSDLR